MSSKGYKHTEEARRKIGEASKGRKHTKETLRKMSASRKGDKNFMWGRKRSEETKRKISKTTKAYGKTYEMTEEIRLKMSSSQKAFRKKQPPEERKRSEETKRKISKTMKAQWAKRSPEERKPSKEALQNRKKAMSKALKGRTPAFRAGFYQSTKAGTIHHRSSLERDYYKELDKSVLVESFKTEPFALSYFNPKDNKTHKYIPDLLITYIDGSKKLVELKPIYKFADPVNQAKFRAARIYAKKQGWTFEVWTEKAVA